MIKKGVKSESQDTYDSMTFFRDSSSVLNGATDEI